VDAGFWWGNFEETDNMQDLGVGDNIKMDLKDVEYEDVD
jgi:hypothetical protein